MIRSRRRRGLAALVDSLCFLAVAAVISLSLVASTIVLDHEGQDWSAYVSDAHEAMLDCQVQIPIEGKIIPRTEVSALAVMMLRSEENRIAIMDPLVSVTIPLLKRLIPSSMDFEWVIVDNDQVIRLGGTPSPDVNCLYLSSIRLSSIDSVTSRLAIWPSLG